MKKQTGGQSDNLSAMRVLAVVSVALLAACQYKVALYCDETTECTDPERPFCDLRGEFPASDGVSNTCIPNPGGLDAGPDGPTGPQVIAISAGTSHTCAILDTGGIRCWGANASNQLGTPTNGPIGDDEPASAAPELVLSPPPKAVAAGGGFTCALLESETVRCWGDNQVGQLGYGDTEDRGDNESVSSLVDIDFGGKSVLEIEAGGGSTCAVVAGAEAYCWGSGGFYQLGKGNTQNIGDNETPAAAGPLPDGPIGHVSAYYSHACATHVGSERGSCWGIDYSGGVLGVPDQNELHTPGSVEIGAEAEQITVGLHSCARLTGGGVRCWGPRSTGRIGLGPTYDPENNAIGDDEAPATAPLVDLDGPVIQIEAGRLHTCALRESGEVYCWGENQEGQLGYADVENVGDDETPAARGPVDIGGRVRAIAAGEYHTCALLETGQVRCWGRGMDGRLGYGNTRTIGDNETPASVGDVPLF